MQLLGALGALLVLASPAAAQVTALAAPVTLDGPSADIEGLSGLSVARDGTGGLIYLKDVAGVPHVFVSLLAGGSFQVPVEVDAALAGPSSQPVIAAGKGGVLLIAFINDGAVYVVDRASSSTPIGPPTALFDGASDPSIAISSYGKGYLAFTAIGAGGHDVRCGFYDSGQWSVESAPLDAVPADDAGSGTGRPAVAAAGDGVGIVAWGEAGHIYARRVWGTSPSIAVEQADVPSVGGWTESSSGDPSVAVGGDSSYVQVAFDEVVTDGPVQQSRVILNRLHGSVFEGVRAADGLQTPAAEGADEPTVSMSEYGYGLATAALDQSNQLFVTTLGANGQPGSPVRLDSLPNTSTPYVVPIAAGYYSGLVAWQQDPGTLGSAEIRARFYDGSAFGPEMVVSSPSLGPTDAARGLAVGGDIAADIAIAWVQGTGADTQIVVAQLYQPPGGFRAAASFRLVRSIHPLLTWTPPREMWGPLYEVSVDGTPVARTIATSIRTPALAQGPHSWQVTGVNGGGLQSSTAAATVFVDTVAPTVSFTVSGTRRVHTELHAYVTYSDVPLGGTAADSSGIASVVVRWGDGSSYAITHGKYHAYAQAKRYTVTVVVGDKAGNTTTVTKVLKIAKPVVKKKKKKKHGTGNGVGGGSGGAHP